MLTRIEFQFPQAPRIEKPTENERHLLEYTTSFKNVVAEIFRTLNRPNIMAIDQAGLTVSSYAFAALPPAVDGALVRITDSSTATWGATIAGGGANNVLAWYNGSNWTVVGA